MQWDFNQRRVGGKQKVRKEGREGGTKDAHYRHIGPGGFQVPLSLIGDEKG